MERVETGKSTGIYLGNVKGKEFSEGKRKERKVNVEKAEMRTRERERNKEKKERRGRSQWTIWTNWE